MLFNIPLPPRAMKLVVEWLNLHRGELYENWDLFWDDETYLEPSPNKSNK